MASKLQTREVNIPFPGFYYSHYSADLDREAESMAENETETGNEYGESQFPEPLQISESDIAELIFDCSDWGAMHRHYAASYADAFSYLAGEKLGISAPEMVSFYSWQEKKQKKEKRQVYSLRLSGCDMTSPREYNFETDRIFCQMPESVIRKLWAINRVDGFASLDAVTRRRFTSYDGFISFYRNDWHQWGKLADWDSNQLATLLIAACESVGFDCEDDSNLQIYYAVSESETAYHAFSEGFDYSKFEALKTEKRAELFLQWIEDEPECAKDWAGNNAESFLALCAASEDLRAWEAMEREALPYRCTMTPDLFSDMGV